MLCEVRRFVREQVVGLKERIDAEDEVPARVRARPAELGLFGFAILQRFGGIGPHAGDRSAMPAAGSAEGAT